MTLRPIPCFPDYAASADGRVWRVTPVTGGNNAGRPVPFEMSIRRANSKRASVSLYRRSTEGLVNIEVYRVICAAFHGIRPQPDAEVNFIDGNATNFAAANLYWRIPQIAKPLPAKLTNLLHAKPVPSILEDLKELGL